VAGPSTRRALATARAARSTEVFAGFAAHDGARYGSRVIVALPREIAPGEKRIALVPESVARLAKLGVEIHVEAAGDAPSFFPDAAYEAAGAKLVVDPSDLYGSADVLVKVQPPRPHPRAGHHEVELLREGAALICILSPFANPGVVKQLAARRIASFAMDRMPRITRAQAMDVLSSQATIAGYKAVLIAAGALPKLLPMLMTAAGTLRAARVLVLGAGVAGLQAIATARRLGAVVEAFDVRPAVKEQVESLGARFVAHEGLRQGSEDAGGYARELSAEQQARQRELLSEHIAGADALISTAQVPGRRAPLLVTRAQVERMRPGSVVVDLAAESGGNCELTRAGSVIEHAGVQIHGPVDLPSSVPVHASQMLSRNYENYLVHLIRDGALALDLNDELTRAPLVTRDGAVLDDALRAALQSA
jgi:proton-translocating NAD(P)+ transhydrogenase subunit alpha